MITAYFEYHALTIDNEAGKASGHYDVELSVAGRKQAAEEKAPRYRGIHLDAVFTSDTRRGYETARIMFADKDVSIVRDARLRECDYGDLTRHPSSEVRAWRARSNYISFPNGESYEQIVERMKSFLDDLGKGYGGKTVLIIGHGATRVGLEHLVQGAPLADALTTKWPLTAKYELGPTDGPR